MLTPTGNLQEWIDNQNKQLRSESDIKIEVFSHTGNVCSLLTTLTKGNFESFNIQETVSALSFEVPQTNISFKVFKNGTIENTIKNGHFIRISYGYLINGSWSWVVKGVYEISKATVQNNGLTADYEAKILRYKLLEQPLYYGLRAGGNTSSDIVRAVNTYLSTFESFVIDFNYEPLISTAVGGTTMGKDRSCISILSSVAQANGCLLTIKGVIDDQTMVYKLVCHFERLTSYELNTSYIVEYSSQTRKPESIESQYTYDGYEIVERVENYYFDSNAGGGAQFSGDDEVILTLPAEFSNKGIVEYDFPRFPYATSRSATTGYDFNVLDENGNDVTSQYSSGQDLDVYNHGFKISCNNQIPSYYSVKFRYFAYSGISQEIWKASGKNPISIDNPFICCRCNTYDGTVNNHDLVNRIRQTVVYMKGKEEMTVECRFDPRLEAGDCILIATDSDTYERCVVEHYTMSYNGSFKGTIDSCDLGEIERVYARFYASNKTTLINEQEMWQGETPTAPTTPPNPPSTLGNAVYSSIGSFKEWKPTLAPIEEDTNFYPTYNNTAFHEYEQTYDEDATFTGQLAAWTSRPLSIGSIVTPHIANLKKLINNPRLTIPANDGHGFATTSQPTVFRGDEDNDLWQANYIQFSLNPRTNKWEITSIKVFSTDDVRTLCIGQDNRLWFATSEEKRLNHLTVISDEHLDVLADKFKYNSATNSFVYNGQTGETTCAYKRIN